MASNERFGKKQELPPQIITPNIFPISWPHKTQKMEEIWQASQREYWDPEKLPWNTFDVKKYSWEEREAMAYWWSLLCVFDASAPPVFCEAVIKTYELHEEDPVRKCFFSITRDEHNHEQMCRLSITKLLDHHDPLKYVPKTEIGKKAQRNAHWLFYNGSRYWTGYKKALPKYSLPVLFSSFLMGEIAAATIFQQMAQGCTEPLFKEAFKNIGRDEGRHMAICMSLMERDYPHISDEEREIIPKQIRAGYFFLSGVLFEPPEEFWDIPENFIAYQREVEAVARRAGFHIPEYEPKKQNWKNAMLNLKGVLDKFNIPFPAIPEVGITGKEILDVDMEDIIPVF